MLRTCFPSAMLALSCALPAQITNLGGHCYPPAALNISGSPVAGASLSVMNNPNGLADLILVGFSDPSSVFTSCGCVQHAAVDLVYAQGATIPLPPGSTGFTFYLQGVKFYHHQAYAPLVPCTEFAPVAYFGLSPGYRVAIQ